MSEHIEREGVGRRNTDMSIDKSSMLKWLGGVVTLASVIGGIMAFLGARIVGPGAEIAELRQAMTNLATTQSTTDIRLRRLEDALSLYTYLMCVQIRRTDPAAIPAQCSQMGVAPP